VHGEPPLSRGLKEGNLFNQRKKRMTLN